MPQPFSNQWRLWPPDLDLTYDPRPPWTVCALCLAHGSTSGASTQIRPGHLVCGACFAGPHDEDGGVLLSWWLQRTVVNRRGAIIMQFGIDPVSGLPATLTNVLTSVHLDPDGLPLAMRSEPMGQRTPAAVPRCFWHLLAERGRGVVA